MRKAFKLAPLFLSLLIFTGCQGSEKEVETFKLTGKINNESVEGIYTGTVKKEIPNGDGFITVNSDSNEWEYKGKWEAGIAIGDGELKNKEIAFKFNDIDLKGLYTGETSDGIPNGTGSIKVSENSNSWTYEGEWTKGEPTGNGNVTGKDYEIAYQEATLSGKYDGAVTSFLPDGKGVFKYKSDDKFLNYDGEFSKGNISGIGNIDSNIFKVYFPEVTRTGSYKGELLNGTPNAQGTFSSADDDNEAYTYTGEWKDGVCNGQGKQIWENKEYSKNIGNFKNGDFAPTLAERIVAYGSSSYLSFSVTKRALNFLDENSRLFPAKSASVLKKYVSTSIEYKHLKKQPSKYGDKLINFTNYQVTQISEGKEWGKTYSRIIAWSSSYNDFVYIFYPGSLNIYENDTIEIYGLPLSDSSYENTGGGTTLCYAILGSYIKKTN